MSGHGILRNAAALALSAGLATAALAQGSPVQPQPKDPNMPSAQNTVPEKIDPKATGSTGGTLSDKLERTDGVIKPPSGVDPGITSPAPVPNPGTTPVIPPPGSPGGNPTVQPK
jgi:hypothetical protein